MPEQISNCTPSQDGPKRVNRDNDEAPRENPDRERGDLTPQQEEGESAKDALSRAEYDKIELERELQEAIAREETLSKDLQKELRTNKELQAKNETQLELLEARREEVKSLTLDFHKAEKQSEFMLVKLDALDAVRREHEEKRDVLRLSTDRAETVDVRLAKKEGDSYRKQLAELEREKQLLERKSTLSGKDATSTRDLILMNENALKQLDNEADGLERDCEGHRRTIEELKAEEGRHRAEIARLLKLNQGHMDEILEHDEKEKEIAAEVLKAEEKLKERKRMFDGIQRDASKKLRTLLDKQQAVSRARTAFDVANRQSKVIKEEIAKTERALLFEHFGHHNVELERKAMADDIECYRTRTTVVDKRLEELREEAHGLLSGIREAERERDRLVRDHSTIMSDRDVLSAQIVSRDEELARIQEQLQTQQSSLTEGEGQYNQVTSQIKECENSFSALIRERDHIKSLKEKGQSLEKARLALETDLLREQAKNKALADELRRPMNIHRWRKLADTKPDAFELIRRAQKVQRQILDASDDFATLTAQLCEGEECHNDVKTSLERTPGVADVKERLVRCKGECREVSERMERFELDLQAGKRQAEELREELLELGLRRRQLASEWVEKAMSKKCDETAELQEEQKDGAYSVILNESK